MTNQMVLASFLNIELHFTIFAKVIKANKNAIVSLLTTL